jgi:hypothetical protein
VVTYRGKAGIPYLYSYRRAGGRVVRGYVTSGPAALALAAERERLRTSKAVLELKLLRIQRRARRAKARARAEIRDFRASWVAFDLEVGAVFGAVEAVFRAAMAASGYHLHKRHEWRRRRRARASDVDGAAVAELPERRRLRGWSPELIAQVFDVEGCGLGRLEGRLAAGLAAGDRLAALVLLCRARRRAEALAGDEANPILALLARRTAVAQLYVEAVAAQAAATRGAGEGAPQLVRVLEAAADKADRRLRRAARTLAKVKALFSRPGAARDEGRVEASGPVAADVEAAELGGGEATRAAQGGGARRRTCRPVAQGRGSRRGRPAAYRRRPPTRRARLAQPGADRAAARRAGVGRPRNGVAAPDSPADRRSVAPVGAWGPARGRRAGVPELVAGADHGLLERVGGSKAERRPIARRDHGLGARPRPGRPTTADHPTIHP